MGTVTEFRRREPTLSPEPKDFAVNLLIDNDQMGGSLSARWRELCLKLGDDFALTCIQGSEEKDDLTRDRALETEVFETLAKQYGHPDHEWRARYFALTRAFIGSCRIVVFLPRVQRQQDDVRMLTFCGRGRIDSSAFDMLVKHLAAKMRIPEPEEDPDKRSDVDRERYERWFADHP